jgi:hypothetical protein
MAISTYFKGDFSMKKRLHDKKAGIAILLALIVISLAEMIFRVVALGTDMLTTSNLGEQVAVVALATTILILTAKGKDRACYICYGAWIGYFVLDQIFELSSVILDVFTIGSNGFNIVLLAPALHAVSMVCIIAIGIIIGEYMTDGTIYNKAFNALSVVAILSIVGCIIVNIISVANGLPITALLVTFNSTYRLTMLFLFTFFAYDSAKVQLKKTNLKK